MAAEDVTVTGKSAQELACDAIERGRRSADNAPNMTDEELRELVDRIRRGEHVAPADAPEAVEITEPELYQEFCMEVIRQTTKAEPDKLAAIEALHAAEVTRIKTWKMGEHLSQLRLRSPRMQPSRPPRRRPREHRRTRARAPTRKADDPEPALSADHRGGSR